MRQNVFHVLVFFLPSFTIELLVPHARDCILCDARASILSRQCSVQLGGRLKNCSTVSTVYTPLSISNSLSV